MGSFWVAFAGGGRFLTLMIPFQGQARDGYKLHRAKCYTTAGLGTPDATFI